jgi:E3 ubiquitin-protein ligase RNF14
VSCPSVTCVKKRATKDTKAGSQGGDDRNETNPELVESVVGPGLRARWEVLKEKRRAEIGRPPYSSTTAWKECLHSDPSYTVCPQPFCQAAVPPPPRADTNAVITQASQKRTIRLSEISSPSSSSSSSSPTPLPIASPDTQGPVAAAAAKEDRWDRYRICPSCQYSFCLYCSATWHGPHTPCAFPQTSAIVLEYLSYPENSGGRRRMEVQKGKGNLDRMVAQWYEDEANKKWLQESTRACSGCGVRVEKR